MRGRPVLGAIGGLLFGIGVAVLLALFGIWPVDNLSFFGLPGLGLVLGLLLAWKAPFGKKAAREPAPAREPEREPEPTPAPEGSTSSSPTTEGPDTSGEPGVRSE